MDAWSFPIPTWIVVTVGTLSAYFIYSVWNFGIFKRLGIRGPTPYPVFGTLLPMFQEGFLKSDLDMRKKYGTVVGTYNGRTPVLLIFDTDILKQVLVKDFSNFTNRLDIGFREYPLRKILSVLEDEQWKHVRNHLTPTFSSRKLRKMNEKMLHCVETFLRNLERKAESKEIFDFRELCGAFTMDAIASTAFGLQIDSHNDPSNQFVSMGKKAFDFGFTSPYMLLLFIFPFLMKPLGRLGISIFPRDVVSFFVATVDRAMSERQEVESDNVDFLQLMINAEANEDEHNSGRPEGDAKNTPEETWTKSRGLTHEEVLAQGILFFLAGYETTANTLSLFGYSLAVNPDIQERLIREIDGVMKDQQHVTYDLVHKMPYLDRCLSEVLRLYPAAPRTDRRAKNDTVINGLFIPKGTVVGVPIYALQNDPEIWPNPEKFDPERFTAEAKESRDPFVYLPFGIGPRNCVGMRLALTELKMAMAHVLLKLKFVACEETQIPLKLDKIRMRGVNGIKIRMEKR